jgi:hypothetical protein
MKIDINKTLYALLLLVFLGSLALGVLRMPSKDGSRYLLDSAMMAECLRNGQWFGQEDVGEHGILFKLPAALLFVVFGNHAFIGTFITVLLATACCGLSFMFFRQVLKSDAWALAATWLLVTNYQFVHMAPSYLRGIPLLFATLLLFMAILNRWNKWVIGLLFLLLLDAKESMFFVAAPPFVIWVCLDEWQRPGNGSLTGFIRAITERCTAAFIPSAAWLGLMFLSPVVPVNVWIAQLFGLTVKGIAPEIWHYTPRIATKNLWYVQHGPPQLNVPETSALNTYFVKPFNLLLSYISKIFYPDTFSFFGMPKVMAYPAVFMSFRLFNTYRRKREYNLLFLIMILWFFLLIFILRRGHARYMFPMFPLLILFFIIFLKNAYLWKKFTIVTLAFTVTAVFIGLNFDPNLKKVAMNLFAVLLIGCALFCSHKPFQIKTAVQFTVPILIGCMTLAYWLQFAIFHRLGPIYDYIRYGYNAECAKVMACFEADEVICINDPGWHQLMYFYRHERRHHPKWNYSYKSWLPDKALPKRPADFKTYELSWRDEAEMREFIREKNIERIGMLASTLPEDRIHGQNFIADLERIKWIEKNDVISFKNKKLHLFRVIYDQ